MNATYETPHHAAGQSGTGALKHTDTPELGNMDFEVPAKVIHKVPFGIRNHFVAMVGEFVGTFLFLFFAFAGTQTANNLDSGAGLSVKQTGGANPQQLMYISLSFGFSLAVNAWVFFRISGGLFNPAVTIGMALIGALPPLRAALLFVTEIIAGIAAAAVVRVLYPGPLKVQTTLGGGTSAAQGVFIEMFLTAQLIVAIFMLAAEKHKGTFIAPVGIGLSLFISELAGVYYTGGSLNPARSFGPAVALASFDSHHWVYWVGPIAGALIAAGFYRFIKFMEYETANPGQDVDAATEVEKKRQDLIESGVPPAAAHHAATGLAEKARKESDADTMGRKMSQSTAHKGSSDSTWSEGSEATHYHPGVVPPMPAAYVAPTTPTQSTRADATSNLTPNRAPRFARTPSSNV